MATDSFMAGASVLDITGIPANDAQRIFMGALMSFIELNSHVVRVGVLKAFVVGYSWGAQDDELSMYLCRVLDKINGVGEPDANGALSALRERDRDTDG